MMLAIPVPASSIIFFVVIALFSLLPAIYALAVHIFLFSFRERITLFGEWRRYWTPILGRFFFAFANVAITMIVILISMDNDENDDFIIIDCDITRQQQQCLAMMDNNSRQVANSQNDGSATTIQRERVISQLFMYNHCIVLLTMFCFLATLSIRLVRQTHKLEVDGPIPPSPSTSSLSRSIIHDESDNHYYDLSGKTILITGANAGIGYETTKQLYSRGANILLGCRSEEKAIVAMRCIIGENNCHCTSRNIPGNLEEKVQEESFHPSITTGEKMISSSSSCTRIIMAEDKSIQQRLHTDEKKTNLSSLSSSSSSLGRLYFLPLDLASCASIHKAVSVFLQMNMPLHILINNAGVMRNQREVTEDGFEMTMAANHFGHFLLTNLLLPKLRDTALKEGASSRVITISSSLHRNATRPCRSSFPSHASKPRVYYGVTTWTDKLQRLMTFCWRHHQSSEPGIDLMDLNCERKVYSLFGQYAQTKLANIMFAFELNRRERKFRLPSIVEQSEKKARGGHIINSTDSLKSYPQVVSYCVHPGLARTDFVRDMPWYLYYPNKIAYLIMITLQKTPKSGAYTTVFCATLDTKSERNNTTDSYFVNSELQRVASCALREEDAAKLWELSSDFVSRGKRCVSKEVVPPSSSKVA